MIMDHTVVKSALAADKDSQYRATENNIGMKLKNGNHELIDMTKINKEKIHT